MQPGRRAHHTSPRARHISMARRPVRPSSVPQSILCAAVSSPMSQVRCEITASEHVDLSLMVVVEHVPPLDSGEFAFSSLAAGSRCRSMVSV